MAKDNVTVTVAKGRTLGIGGKTYSEGDDVRVPAHRALKLVRQGHVQADDSVKAKLLDLTAPVDGVVVEAETGRAGARGNQ